MELVEKSGTMNMSESSKADIERTQSEFISSEDYEEGYSDGHDAGFREGCPEGYNNGYHDGNTKGYKEGQSEGYKDGYSNGYDDGYRSGHGEGYDQGYNDAIQRDTPEDIANAAYNDGYSAGYSQAEDDLVYSDNRELSDDPFWDAVKVENVDVSAKPNGARAFWMGFLSAVSLIGLIVSGMAYVYKAVSKRR